MRPFKLRQEDKITLSKLGKLDFLIAMLENSDVSNVEMALSILEVNAKHLYNYLCNYTVRTNLKYGMHTKVGIPVDLIEVLEEFNDLERNKF